MKDALPDNLNYGGDTIVFINDIASESLPDEIYAESLNSDPVNDIIFERNKAVESRLNVKIERVLAGNDWVVNQVITSVNSGSKDYDVMIERAWRGAPKTIDGYFANLRETEYLNFDQPWWMQGFNEVMQYKDLQFAVTGAMLLSSYRRTHTTFNKKLFSDANQEYLYSYVENGTWTLDRQSALAPILSRDNGNSVQDEGIDTFGFVTNTYTSVDPYWSACDIDIVSANNEDGYEWVFDTERMHDAMEKLLNLYYNSDNGTLVLTDDDSLQAKTRQIFSEGRAAMATLCIIALEETQMRNMTDAYGVVPMPKYDEAQANYQSYMHDAFTIVAIPTTVQGDRLSETSAVLEAMASISYNMVRPVYYETTLRTKIAQDPQSAEMMEVVINGIYIDPGIVFSHNLDSYHQSIQAILLSKTNSTVSYFKTKEKAAQKQLQSLTKKLDKLAENAE